MKYKVGDVVKIKPLSNEPYTLIGTIKSVKDRGYLIQWPKIPILDLEDTRYYYWKNYQIEGLATEIEKALYCVSDQ